MRMGAHLGGQQTVPSGDSGQVPGISGRSWRTARKSRESRESRTSPLRKSQRNISFSLGFAGRHHEHWMWLLGAASRRSRKGSTHYPPFNQWSVSGERELGLTTNASSPAESFATETHQRPLAQSLDACSVCLSPITLACILPVLTDKME